MNTGSRQTIFLIVAASVIFSCVCCFSPTSVLADRPTVGAVPQDFSLPDESGKAHSLGEFRGKVVFLDFWASWCPPCLVSLPWLETMYRKHRDDGFSVIGINVDEERENAQRILKKIPLSFEVLFDPEGKVPSAFALPVMPTSYLIGPDGRVILEHSGFRDGDKEILERKIKEALEEVKK